LSDDLINGGVLDRRPDAVDDRSVVMPVATVGDYRPVRSGMVKASGADRSAAIVGDDRPVMATGGVRPTMKTDVAGRPTTMPAAATVDEDRSTA